MPTMQPDAGPLNIAIRRGSDWTLPVTWETGSPAVAVDLTGYTARAQIRERPGGGALIHTLTTENDGIVIESAEDGEFYLFIPGETSLDFAPGNHHWDLLMYSAGARPRCLLAGRADVSLEVTTEEEEEE